MRSFAAVAALALALASRASALPEVANAASAKGDASFGSNNVVYEDASSFQPVQYGSSSGFYSEPTFTSSPPSYNTGGGLGGGLNLFGTNNLISTALNVAMGLFFFSVIIQIVQKVFEMPIFDDILGEARSMSSDDMVMYTNMIADAYRKFAAMNETK